MLNSASCFNETSTQLTFPSGNRRLTPQHHAIKITWMPRMRIPLLVALFALFVVANARAADSCNRAGLIEKLSTAPQLDSAPVISKQQGVQVSRFFLSGSSLAIDGFKYDALVDSMSAQAWVVQYSGIAGNVQWFGPVTVESETVVGCPERFPAQFIMHSQARAASQSDRGATQ